MALERTEGPVPPKRERVPREKVPPPAWLQKEPHEPWHNLTHHIKRGLRFFHLATSYLIWRMSPKVSEAVQEARNELCINECRFHTKRDDHVWCKLCGCAQVPGADVRIKNGRKAHNCPIGLHDGSRPTIEGKKYAYALVKLKHPNVDVVSKQKKGCPHGNCGKKKKTAAPESG
ncbi:MAG: hypothetical protein ACPGXK_00280 [Phycisphaerae bacterium]